MFALAVRRKSLHYILKTIHIRSLNVAEVNMKSQMNMFICITTYSNKNKESIPPNDTCKIKQYTKKMISSSSITSSKINLFIRIFYFLVQMFGLVLLFVHFIVIYVNELCVHRNVHFLLHLQILIKVKNST